MGTGLHFRCHRVQATDAGGRPGWCCTTEHEAKEKTLNIILDWVTGRAWDVAAANRWTTQPTAQRRFLIAESVGRVMSRALNHVNEERDLHKQSVVDALARALELDKHNYAAKNRLRLKSICRGLASTEINGLRPDFSLAVVVTGGPPLVF